LALTLEDAGKLFIGSTNDFGGALQVGNTQDLSAASGGNASVSFVLEVNGAQAEIVLESQGLLGLGTGVITKPDSVPNSWSLGDLHNIGNIAVNVAEGVLRHNEIYNGLNEDASLFAVSSGVQDAANYAFAFNTVTSRIRGGGNLALVQGDVVVPAVENADGEINDSLSVGILGSKPILEDGSKPTQPVAGSASDLFAYLKANPYQDQVTKRASIAELSLGTPTIGYVDGSTIVRRDITGVRNIGGNYINPETSLEIGAVGMALDNNGVPRVYNIVPA
jgi:hypothetical protein